MPIPDRRAILAGSACALAATIIWSGNFVIARDLGQSFPPVRLALLRWAVASLAVLPIGLVPLVRERAAILRSRGYVLAASLLGVTLFNTLLYIAGRTTATLNMALISTFIPVFIMILAAVLLGERPSGRGIVGSVAATAGVLLLISGGDPARLIGLSLNPGDLVTLCAALLFAGYSILIRRRPADVSQRAMLAATFLTGAALLVPWALWEAAGLPPGGAQLTPKVVGAVLYIGIGASLAAYFLWGRAVELAGPNLAGLIYFSLPLFSGLEAAVLLGEPVTWVHALSGACIVGGIALGTAARTPRLLRARRG